MVVISLSQHSWFPTIFLWAMARVLPQGSSSSVGEWSSFAGSGGAARFCGALEEAFLSQFPPDFEIRCACAGVILDSSGGTIPLGKYHLNCMSDGFFASPDDAVWWRMVWTSDFDENGLIEVTQTIDYVLGRDDDSNYEIFTYDHSNPDVCDLSVDRALGYDCETCQRISSSNNGDDGGNTCYSFSCGNGITVIEDTCAVPFVTDFVNQPLAASLAYRQSNVRQVVYDGGAFCVSTLMDIFAEYGQILECTCERYDGPEADLDPEQDETAVFVSCRRPCTYGPESGEVEWIEYYEQVTRLTSFDPLYLDDGGSYVWRQTRYQYTKGRPGEEETFRESNIGCALANCFSVTRNDGVSCETLYDRNDRTINLICDDGNVYNFPIDGPVATSESWTSMPFAAKWKEGSECLRSADGTPIPSPPAPAPVPPPNTMTSIPTTNGATCGSSTPPRSSYAMFTTGGCVSQNELGVSNLDTVEECAARCDALEDCVSFEYSACRSSGGTCRPLCQLSSSCANFDMTVNEEDNAFNWFLKFSIDTVIMCDPGSLLSRIEFNAACTDANELGSSSKLTLRDCFDQCNSLSDCISFEYSHEYEACNLSSSCSRSELDVDECGILQLRTDGFSFYGKVECDADGTVSLLASSTNAPSVPIVNPVPTPTAMTPIPTAQAPVPLESTTSAPSLPGSLTDAPIMDPSESAAPTRTTSVAHQNGWAVVTFLMVGLVSIVIMFPL